MSEQTRAYLYTRFENGDIPTAQDFKDIIDSGPNYQDDGLTHIQAGGHNYFGFNDETPSCIVSIKGDTDEQDNMICFKSNDGNQEWNINLNPTNADVPGFSIDDASTGTSTSRLFIDSTGNTGIGTTAPASKLHLLGAADGNYVGATITNQETLHEGFLLAHADDNTVLSRVGAFTVAEKIGSTKVERITILPTIQTPINTYYRVGVNEKLPYATLHVTRPEADAQSDVGLNENTGIILSGPIIGKNLLLDSFQLQARTGAFVGSGPAMAFTATELGIQPLGGDVLVHGGLNADQQFIIDENGLVGLGKTPAERLDINGAVTFGDSISETPAEGTVRWHANPGDPADLMVYKEGIWKSLTTQTVTDGFWTAGAISGQIYYDTAAGNPKVGIGVTSPTSALMVEENNAFQSSSAAALFANKSTTSSSDPSFTRVGVGIKNTGAWSSTDANNIGLYVAEVSGQSNANANLAAVLNGSTVIGNLTGQPIVGANGTNVLAIQSGAVPTTIPGSTANSGIQIFSSEILMPTGVDTSVFNVMTGDGNVIQLFRQGHLLPNANVDDPNTGSITTDDLIKNMRERINALELVLVNMGLLEA